jgi:alpha-1,6-mannosyltransferase
LISCGLASSWIYLRILGLGNLRDQIPEYLLYFFSVSIFYLLAGFVSSRIEDRTCFVIIVVFALIFRFILLFTSPSLSDDIYRYAWEGYLQTKEINPYLLSPEAPQLIPYRNEIWYSVNNKDVSAIYPPLTQLVNATVYSLFKSIWGFKIVFLIFDGLVSWGILKLLKQDLRNLSNIIFYAWNPLVVIEIAGSGHHDVLVVAMILWSTWFCITHRPGRSVVLLAASILSKLYPLSMVPFFLRKIRFRYWIWLPLYVLMGYLPYLKASDRLFSALLYYKEKWRFNGFLFGILAKHVTSEILVERFLVIAILLLMAFCWIRLKDLKEQLYWLTGGILISVPTLFPWYLVWMIPFLCFFPNPAWILLSITSALSYYVLIDWWTLGIWRQNDFFMALEYYPFFGLLLFCLVKKLTLEWKTRCC